MRGSVAQRVSLLASNPSLRRELALRIGESLDANVVTLGSEPTPEHRATQGSFDFREYFAKLRTRQFGHGVLYADEVQSTQDVIAKGLGGHFDGLLCVADVQTAGRGRRGNQWNSPLGCLMFSFGYKQPDPAKLASFQYLIGLGLIIAARASAQSGDIPLSLKWPNDIYAGDAKVGGILCESQQQGAVFQITSGTRTM